LTSGTRITVPDSVVGSIAGRGSAPINISTARMDAYSVPCAPLTTASTGPGRAPWMTDTGMS